MPVLDMSHDKGAIPVHSMPWFHGKIGREEAEKILHPRIKGQFLVRESVHYPGDYTLSVSMPTEVQHYRIINDKNKRLTIDEESFFNNLAELVEHYEVDDDGLCSRLVLPLERKGQVDVVVNQTDFAASGWQIDKKDIALQELIGKGEFSEVYKADYKSMQVAIKIVKDKTTSQQFLKEAYVMTTLKHQNLVQLLGVVLGDTIYIVTEYMSKGSLVDYLRTRGRSVITKDDQIHFARDTCCGMRHLETKNIVHRDLAARNVLVHENGLAKVSDFGLALPHDVQQATGGKVPIKWTAPEALKQHIFTSKSDMWSFGILLWEIYSFGRVPYPKIPLADVMSHLERGYRMEQLEGCPDEVYKIMLQAWHIDPAKRPTFHDVQERLVDLCSTAV